MYSYKVCCFRRILGITWQHKVTNKVVLEKGDTKLIHSLKAKVHAMARTCDTDERGPHSKDLLYGELAIGKRPTGRFKDVCKRDLLDRLLESYCHRQRYLETHSKSGVITIRRNTASKKAS